MITKTFFILGLLFTFGLQAFAQTPTPGPQVATPDQANAGWAQDALRDLDGIKAAFGKSFNRNFSIGGMALSAKLDTTYGASWKDVDWQSRFCSAIGFDYGLQEGTIDSTTHLHYAATYMTGLEKEAVANINKLQDQVMQTLSATSTLYQECFTNSKSFSKEQIVTYLKSTDGLYESILTLQDAVAKTLTHYLIPSQ